MQASVCVLCLKSCLPHTMHVVHLLYHVLYICYRALIIWLPIYTTFGVRNYVTQSHG